MRHLLYFFLFLFLYHSAIGQEKSDTLRVGYAGSAPFIIHKENPEGIVIDIWNEIAFGLQKEFLYVDFATVDEGISAIKNADIDVFIGPITINSARAKEISFTQPFHNTELAILAPVLEKTFWERIKPFFSMTFLYAVIGLMIILTLVGSLFWLVEGRKDEADYGKGFISGIGSGIWLAIVTMTTVGYGDFAPKTTAGRFIIGAWMVISLILATSFVAGIATTFSQSSKDDQTITNLTQLQRKRVAVPNYKKIADIIRDFQGIPIPVEDVSEGYRLLLDEKVDAVIYDEIPLEYIFEREKEKDYVLSRKRIEPQFYGFMLPLENILKKEIDLQIIHLLETKRIAGIIDDWIHKN